MLSGVRSSEYLLCLLCVSKLQSKQMDVKCVPQIQIIIRMYELLLIYRINIHKISDLY